MEESVYLQSVLIRDTMDMKEIKQWVRYYIRHHRNKLITSKLGGWYRFRNIFEGRFIWLKNKHVNERVILVYGAIKDYDLQNVRVKERAQTLSDFEGNDTTAREEMPLQSMSTGVPEKVESTPTDGVHSTPILKACRICGKSTLLKHLRRIHPLRGLEIKQMKMWCRDCQLLWKKANLSPISETDSSFQVNLD